MGAAIAAGNHLENGICALFVIAATIIKVICRCRIRVLVVACIFMIYQCPWFRVKAMATSSSASPMRLDRAVSIPAARDFAFW